jgi:hypothetical protein
MKLTKEFLRANIVCPEGYKWAIENGLIGLEPEEVIERLITSGRLMDANWYLTRLMSNNQLVKYALNAATMAVKVFQSSYEDKNVEEALQIAQQYLGMEKTIDNFLYISHKALSIIDALEREIKYKEMTSVKCFAVDAEVIRL